MADARVRRGLPRNPGGETWPPVATSTATEAPAPPPTDPQTSETPRPVRRGLPRAVGDAPAAAPLPAAEPARPAKPVVVATSSAPSAAERPGVFHVLWTLAVTGLLGGFVGLILAASVVIGVRALLSLDFMQDFLAAFPGEYALPAGSEAGFPAWVQWQHFFTAFLMVLIIRTGWQVRTQKRPAMFWTPRWSKNGRGKVSIALWFHLSLDVLWLANGLIFVVLLFVSGHWVRIVPTSLDVFPNALSAALQYATLEWPTHNGWVNYNGLQQLMYFITVFVAAPLAAISGVRMSSLWPKNAAALNRWYPVEWARAIHFPVMLFFVGFIIVHVTLVFATGALRNLNHIYGGTDAENWVGAVLFAGSMALIVAAWFLARPLLLAPIASLTGKVTGR